MPLSPIPQATPRVNRHSQNLPQSFFACPAEQVASELIGYLLVKRQPSGVMLLGAIVEMDGYCQSVATNPMISPLSLLFAIRPCRHHPLVRGGQLNAIFTIIRRRLDYARYDYPYHQRQHQANRRSNSPKNRPDEKSICLFVLFPCNRVDKH